jgi:hypothetical protein
VGVRLAKNKIRTLYIFLTVLILIPSVTLADEISGNYKAVTESEAVIELDLKKDNSAVLITGWLPEEPDASFKPYLRYGQWFQSDGFVIVEIKGLGKLRYKVMDYLSYREFDNEGGSFGLSPDKTNEKPFNLYGLWRKSDLLKHFKN